MSTIPERWEHGSEFHWPIGTHEARDTFAPRPWDREDALLLGCGRDALRLVIEHGRLVHDWRRLWVPSYMCQHVVDTLVQTGIDCAVYHDAPDRPRPDVDTLGAREGEAVLVVNYFGLRTRSALEGLSLRGASLVVDHTHDPLSPWAREGTADYALASLRKTLPIPEGGALWSPAGHRLPEAPSLTDQRALAAESKRTSMMLKGRYLDGESLEKASYRTLASTGESSMAQGPISGISPETRQLLATLPADRWREQRKRNFMTLKEALTSAPGITTLVPQQEGCPFSAFLVFDEPERRDRVRQVLIRNGCYPAVLWPLDQAALDGVPDAHRLLAARSLSVHCDMRYGAEDMGRVAALIREAVS